MGIRGKKEVSFRLVGMVFLLIGIMLTIIFDAYLIKEILLIFFSITIMVLLFSLILGFKFQTKFLSEYRFAILTLVSILSISLIIGGSFLSRELLQFLIFLILTLSNSLAIISWHFSLSFYKKKKLIFALGVIINIFISLCQRIPISMKKMGLIFMIPLILIIIGTGFITVAEILLMKKGLLKYL